MKICCFGSLNIDMVFSVDEFVRPQETIQSRGLAIFSGGKGLNQAMAILKSGAAVFMAGSIGPDGERLLEECDAHGLDRKWVRTLEISTGRAVIQVDRRGENCIILYDGANRRNDTGFMDEVLADLEPGDFLVLQNEINELGYLIGAAQERGILTFLNPSPMDEALPTLPLERCYALILNEIEGAALSGETQPEGILKALAAQYPETAVILTLGSQGVMYHSSAGSGLRPAYRVRAVDTTGAGDAFSGYFIGLMAQGYTMAEAMDLAQKAAAISVTRSGASQSIPYVDEVMAARLEPGQS